MSSEKGGGREMQGETHLAPHLELEALAFLLVELIPQVGERLLGDIERVRLFLDQLQLLDARPHVLRQFL